MPTFMQLTKRLRRRKLLSSKSLVLNSSPQKKGICVRVYSINPKKPNSAERKVAKIKFSSGKSIIGYVPGEKHNLQEHALVLVRGGRVKDLPGVKFHLIRGVYDLHAVLKRKKARSKYGKRRN